jgi:sulfur carrier protein
MTPPAREIAAADAGPGPGSGVSDAARVSVRINDAPHALARPATVADAVAAIGAVAPYAVAVNRVFAPRSTHATHALADGDRIEVIRPVTGG